MDTPLVVPVEEFDIAKHVEDAIKRYQEVMASLEEKIANESDQEIADALRVEHNACKRELIILINTQAELLKISAASEEAVAGIFTVEEWANVRAAKLTNGEDIIGVILAITDTHILVRRPCKILRVAHPDGQVAIIMVKWQPFSNDDSHAIRIETVVGYSRMTTDMKEFYAKCVVSQLKEEELEAGRAEAAPYEWPEWMDEVIAAKDTTRIN